MVPSPLAVHAVTGTTPTPPAGTPDRTHRHNRWRNRATLGATLSVRMRSFRCMKVHRHQRLPRKSARRVTPCQCRNRAQRKPRVQRGAQARRTGLEPATTGSTVRDSIQLSYRPRFKPHYSNSITRGVKNLHFASIQRVLMADSTTSGTRKSIADSIRFVMNWRSGSACSCGASKTSSS